MHQPKKQLSRRSFLSKSAAATLGISVLPSYLALGKADGQGNLPPSQRINLAFIGLGSRGRQLARNCVASGIVKVVAICDVDFHHEFTPVDFLEAHADASRFKDFRVMFDKMGDDIDAVVIATPDHLHYVQTLEAMRRGIHVYVEKPLTHTFNEAENLRLAAEKYKVVTQMGNQGQSSAGAAQFQNMVKSGAIKDIIKIETYRTPRTWYMYPEKRLSSYPKEPIPGTLDYDLWCGPAQMLPFHHLMHPFNWRGFLEYGSGALGDWGAHLLNFPHQHLKMGLPTRVEAVSMEDHNSVIYPVKSHLKLHFPARSESLPACDVTWVDGVDPEPTIDPKYLDTNSKGEVTPLPTAQHGTILHRKDGEFIVHRLGHGEVSRIYPRAKMIEHAASVKAPKVQKSHTKNFLSACMGKGSASSPFSVAAELTQMITLGRIAQYLNQSFSFDPATKTITDNPAALTLLDGNERRPGWEDYYTSI